MKNVLHLIIVLFVSLQIHAKQKTITGTIIDGDALPLPGVNVVVKGTSNGTSTDFDGHYSISAQVGDIIVFAYVGSTIEKTVGANNIISFAMEQQALEEIVITAMGIKKGRKALGCFSSVALSGKVSGISVRSRSKRKIKRLSNSKPLAVKKKFKGAVGSSSRIVLRGNSSISGDNKPLFIVDGVPLDNSINSEVGLLNLKNENIESISVLSLNK